MCIVKVDFLYDFPLIVFFLKYFDKLTNYWQHILIHLFIEIFLFVYSQLIKRYTKWQIKQTCALLDPATGKLN